MPILTIHGIPSKYRPQKLEEIRSRLKEAGSSVPALDLQPTAIIVYFIPDLNPRMTGREIVMFMDLYRRPERTPEMLTLVSEKCVAAMREFFSAMSIECFPRHLEPELSFVETAPNVNCDTSSPLCPICDYGTISIGGGPGYRCVNCGERMSGCIN